MSKQKNYTSILSFLLSTFFKSEQEIASSPKMPFALSSGRPVSNNKSSWHVYWMLQGQPWRTEPEIDSMRQQELDMRRAIVPNIEKGIYPLKGVKLNRADVEWLLATHENGRGPVNWSNEIERRRRGIDVRGADLCGVDLNYLPLARLYGGLTFSDRKNASQEQRDMAAVVMQGTTLRKAHLEAAILHEAHLEHANFQSAYLEDARMRGAYMAEVDLSFAYLKGTHFRHTHLENADLRDAHLDGVRLEDAILINSSHVGPQIVDAQWDNANLSVVKWSQIQMLGDERVIQNKIFDGRQKDKVQQLQEYNAAVRANRQLALALQNQGLNEDASRFAYQAQILQRKVLWKQRNIGKWFFSLMLSLLAGYGYHMWRILAAYFFVIFICTAAYFVIGTYAPPHLSLMQALLESITAFHGRVFLEVFTSETPQIWITAIEAVLGLLIEGVFIAMLTQRFFGK